MASSGPQVGDILTDSRDGRKYKVDKVEPTPAAAWTLFVVASS